MRLFTTAKTICLFIILALPVSIETVTTPCQAAAKGKKETKPRSKVPIDTVGPQTPRGIDVTPIISNLDSRLAVYFGHISVGPSKYCEVHFYLLPDGRVANISVYSSSRDPAYDQVAMSCIDQAGPFGPFEGVDRLPCIATFRTEPKGGGVSVSMPGYMGSNSMVDKQIAAKRLQNMNIIKIMKDRIVKAQQVLGSDSPKLSESINFLANTYKDVADYGSAEASYKWAIAIREKANGPNSKELAQSIADLGDMYATKGDLVSAEDCYKRVLNMPDLKPCVDLQLACQRYAKLCLKTGRGKDADFLYKRIEDIHEGKALAPLPAGMTTETNKTQDTASKGSTNPDTKDGGRPGTPVNPDDKSADNTTAKPKDSKANNKGADIPQSTVPNNSNNPSKTAPVVK